MRRITAPEAALFTGLLFTAGCSGGGNQESDTSPQSASPTATAEAYSEQYGVVLAYEPLDKATTGQLCSVTADGMGPQGCFKRNPEYELSRPHYNTAALARISFCRVVDGETELIDLDYLDPNESEWTQLARQTAVDLRANKIVRTQGLGDKESCVTDIDATEMFAHSFPVGSVISVEK